mgnify:CR=1 FL=1
MPMFLQTSCSVTVDVTDALYRYASAGEVSPGFEFAQIDRAFAPKSA